MAFRTLRIAKLEPVPPSTARCSGTRADRRASGTLDGGDWGKAAAIVADGLQAHPGDGSQLYNLACCEAQLGRLDAATEHLGAALADDPRVREWAADDSDLGSLRERPDFPL